MPNENGTWTRSYSWVADARGAYPFASPTRMDADMNDAYAGINAIIEGTLDFKADVAAPSNGKFTFQGDSNVGMRRGGTGVLELFAGGQTGLTVKTSDITLGRKTFLTHTVDGTDEGTTVVNKAYVDAQVANATATALPAGSTLHFAGNNIPTGFLLCDGRAVSRTTYAVLFKAIGVTWGNGDGSSTFNLPDGRGEYLRGLDAGRGVDTGRALGSSQEDSTAVNGLVATTEVTVADGGEHSHTIPDVRPGSGNSDNWPLNDGLQNQRGYATTLNTSTAGSHDHNATATTTLKGDSETRPRNIALNIIIKT